MNPVSLLTTAPQETERHEERRPLTLVLAALVLAALPLALAADAPKAVGTWDVVAQTPNGEMPSVLTIKATEGGVKAEFELDGAARTVSDEKLEGDVLP